MEEPKEQKNIPEMTEDPAPIPLTEEELRQEAEKGTGVDKIFGTKAKDESGNETTSNDGIKRLAIMAGLCIIIVFVMSYIGLGNWVTKIAFDTNYLILQEQVVSNESKVNSYQEQLDNAIQVIPEKVNTATVNANAKIASDFSKLQSDVVALVDTINNSPFDYTSQISNIQTELSSLQSQINSLRAGGLLEWDNVLSVNATVTNAGYLSGNMTVANIKVKITNLTDRELVNVSVTIPCTLDNALYGVRPTVYTSGWYVSEWDGGIMELRSLSLYSMLKNSVQEIDIEIHSQSEYANRTITGIYEPGIKVNTFGYK